MGTQLSRMAVTEYLPLIKRIYAGFDVEYAPLIPLTFAIKRHLPDGIPYWCFLISPKMEDNKEALCIGVDMEKDDPIDRIFLIPTQAFNLRGMYLLTQQDQRYSEWIRRDEDVEHVVPSLLRAVLGDQAGKRSGRFLQLIQDDITKNGASRFEIGELY